MKQVLILMSFLCFFIKATGVIAQSEIDTDMDGLIDKEDDCPTVFGPVSNHGCPELTKNNSKIIAKAIEKIEFEIGSAIITKASYLILNEASIFLKKNKKYRLILSGHTDAIGSSTANEILSERRALICYNYLLTKGIARSRMNYRGLGASQPIGDNHSRMGREHNRRVVFEFVLNSSYD